MFLPACASLAILFALGAATVHTIIEQHGHRRHLRRQLLYCCCSIQFVVMMYNPVAQLPTDADLAAGQKLMNMIAQVDGEVYIPYHGYLATYAGKTAFVHHSAVWDVIRGNDRTDAKMMLGQALRQAIQNQAWDMIILDTEWHFLPGLEEYYQHTGVVFQDEMTFDPVTGMHAQPTYVLVPRHLTPDGVPPKDTATSMR